MADVRKLDEEVVQLARLALAGPVAKREKVKKEKVKKVKPIKEEVGKPESKKSGKDAATWVTFAFWNAVLTGRSGSSKIVRLYNASA